MSEDESEEIEETEAAKEAETSLPESEEDKSGAELAQLEELKKALEDAQKEAAEYKDKYLRKAADFENFQKRARQEKQEYLDYGNASLLKDLLESLDNFDLALAAAATAPDAKTVADGVAMISKGLVSMLENKYNLVAYGAVGDSFDPDIHEAISKSDDPVAEPCIKTVYQKGYKLKERVIRHARVVVSMPDGSVAVENEAQG